MFPHVLKSNIDIATKAYRALLEARSDTHLRRIFKFIHWIFRAITKVNPEQDVYKTVTDRQERIQVHDSIFTISNSPFAFANKTFPFAKVSNQCVYRIVIIFNILSSLAK
jgi:hypothetical protein